MAAIMDSGNPYMISMFRATTAHKEAEACLAKGELGAALDLYNEELAITRRALGPRHLLTLRLQLALATKQISWAEGNAKLAHALFGDCAEAFAAILGEDHSKTKRVASQRDRCFCSACREGGTETPSTVRGLCAKHHKEKYKVKCSECQTIKRNEEDGMIRDTYLETGMCLDCVKNQRSLEN